MTSALGHAIFRRKLYELFRRAGITEKLPITALCDMLTDPRAAHNPLVHTPRGDWLVLGTGTVESSPLPSYPLIISIADSNGYRYTPLGDRLEVLRYFSAQGTVISREPAPPNSTDVALAGKNVTLKDGLLCCDLATVTDGVWWFKDDTLHLIVRNGATWAEHTVSAPRWPLLSADESGLQISMGTELQRILDETN